MKQETEINQICNFPETSDDDDEADDGEGMTEIRFAPDDKATLQVMFSSMSHCQTLHPDPEAAEDAADEEAENDEVRIPLLGLRLTNFVSLRLKLQILSCIDFHFLDTYVQCISYYCRPNDWPEFTIFFNTKSFFCLLNK